MLVQHSFFYLLARGLPGMVSLLAIALFTRLISPEQYGYYTVVAAGASLAGAVIFQWLRLGLLRFLPAYLDRREQFLATVAAGYLFLAAAVTLPGVFLIFLWPEPALRGLLVFGLLILWAQPWYELNLELARSQLAPARYGLIMISRSLLLLFAGGLLAYLGWGAAGLLTGMFLGFLLPSLAVTAREWRGANPARADRAVMRKLLIYGLPLTAAFALDFVVSSSDRFMLGLMVGAQETGLYAVGYDLSKQCLWVLMAIVNLAAYPLVVRAFERGGPEEARPYLVQNAVALVAIALPAAVGLAMLATNIAGVALGPEYRTAAVHLFPWVALGMFFAGMKAYYCDLAFQLGRNTLGQVWVLLAAALINVALNLWWIPVWGYMGAAYATVTAYIAGAVFSVILGRKIYRLPLPGIDLIKIAAATAGMALALWPVRSHAAGTLVLAGQIVWGAAVYGILFLLLDVRGSRSIVAGLAGKFFRKAA